MTGNVQSPPENVNLVYRKVGKTHVFSTEGARGLVHVGSVDRENAFNSVIPALSKHITAAYEREASYTCEMSYSDFVQHLDEANSLSAGFVEFRLDHAGKCCH